MNKAIISGRLTDNARVNGDDRKVMKFTVLSKFGWNSKEKCDHTDYVPCVLFNPTQKLIERLTNQGRGLFLELEGRISRSKFKFDGVDKFSTEVIVNPNTLMIDKQ